MSDSLAVRFRFGGEFFKDGKILHYFRGNAAMSYIDRDKISLPEVVGRLHDHYNVHDGVLLHWLFPGKELHDGLRVLVDDKVCQFMSDSIMDSGVANIYVEEPSVISVSDDEGKGTYKKKGKAI